MYILAIDQSTSATKAMLIDKKCQVTTRINKDHKQFYPKPGWVEHDPEEIYNNLVSAVSELIDTSRISWDTIKAMALTNQRETVLVWDKKTSKPIYNALVWQCARATEICEQLDTAANSKLVRERTGLTLSPYFSAAKIKWILDNVPGAREKAENGELLAGTIDSWLVWKLTGGSVHATDLSNASRMSLLNLKTLDWDPEVCELFTIPQSMLAEIKPSDTIWAETDIAGISPKKLPIIGILGDSHAALFAQLCYKPGMAKATYGTGSSIMMNAGTDTIPDVEGLVTSIGWGLSSEVIYVLEGNINSTGATIKWLVDNLQLLKNPAEAENMSIAIGSTDGVYLVPAFSGLSAPHWNNNARAVISGMSFSTTRNHIVRAGLEAIAYQIADVVNLMTEKSGLHLANLRTDGGPTKNKFLMQFQADILKTPVVPAKIEELSALGVTLIAGLTTGMWKSRDEFEELIASKNTFTAQMPETQREDLYNGWKKAISKVVN